MHAHTLAAQKHAQIYREGGREGGAHIWMDRVRENACQVSVCTRRVCIHTDFLPHTHTHAHTHFPFTHTDTNKRTNGEGAASGFVGLDQVDDAALLVGRDAAGHDGLADLVLCV